MFTMCDTIVDTVSAATSVAASVTHAAVTFAAIEVAARATVTASPLRGRGEEEGGRLGEEVQDIPSRRRAIPTRQRYALFNH